MEIDFRKKRYVLDGGMGTMLQSAGMSPEETTTEFGLAHPEILTQIHKKYIEAGADIVYASTFGTNRFKKKEIGECTLQEAVQIQVKAAVKAKEIMAAQGREVAVAIDLGPLGELLEPMGTLSFEDAYDAFREVIQAGCDLADLIVIETMTDLYEVKAAVLAAKETCDLPVIVTMTFEENGRTFTGVSLEAMVLTLEGLGVDAMGINCSLGPVEIFPMAEKLRSLTDLPLVIKPNAGLPDPATGAYDITCDQFVEDGRFPELGIELIGGCCGTTPEYIEGLAEIAAKFGGTEDSAKPSEEKTLQVCSGNTVVTVDHVTVIGERINQLKETSETGALDEDFDYILSQAIEQTMPGRRSWMLMSASRSLDDVKMLPLVIKKLSRSRGFLCRSIREIRRLLKQLFVCITEKRS